MMSRTKLAVFDMDGTLFDTSEVNFRSYSIAAERFGYKINRTKFMEIFEGRNYKEFLPVFGIVKESELQKVHEEKKNIYSDCLQYARMNEKLFQLIRCIRSEYVVVLATTASRKNTEEILNFFGVSDLFDYKITQDDTNKLKPNPECYLKAMELTGIDYQNTLIFEDSDVGIKAGLATGSGVYKVCGL